MSKTSKFSTDELRKFYFSKATNYAGFQKKDGSVTPSATPAKKAGKQDATSVSLSGIDVSVAAEQQERNVPTPAATPSAPSPIMSSGDDAPSPARAPPSTTKSESSVAAPPPTVSSKGAAGSALAAIKDSKASTSTSLVNGAGSAESVSPEYIAFLRQQQDLTKVHNAIEQQLAGMLEIAAQQRDIVSTSTNSAAELLAEAERSSGWNWKSKFSRESLVKDAGLQVPFNQLCAEEDIPNVIDLQHQHQQLVKLRQDHCSNKDSHAAFRLTLENGIRRFDRLIKEFGHSQLDAAPVVRLSDNLLVQLDQLLSLEPLPLTLQDANDRIAVLAKKQKECMDVRDQAFEDGEMHIAERETFRLVDLSEELAAAQVEKIRLLEKAAEENTVGSEIRDAYSQKATEDTNSLENDTADLRSRCETDLARLYKLKQEVDETDRQLDDKWKEDCTKSDDLLDNIRTRQQEAWDQIASLVKLLRQLEADRHAECKRRVDEKVRNETRRIEYRRFCSVADNQAATLDRTIRNCDTNVHCAKLMAEFLQSGFYTIQKDLTEKRQEIDSALLEAQKSHLEIFRSLLFTLSDLEYKRERRLEEVAANIQAAHIQQELCSDSLNPNAKKFSDAKKELLRVHDELELELRDIRERIQAATEQFKSSEEALVAAGVPHKHPVEEMEDRRLNTRVKMVNYKAMSLGNVSSAPIKEELEQLKKNLEESRRVINNSRSASRNRSRIEE